MPGFPKKCQHNKVKYTCVECEGGGICEHKVNRAYCKVCRGSALCEHGNNKYNCKIAPCDYKPKKKYPITPLEEYEMALSLKQTKRKCLIAKL